QGGVSMGSSNAKSLTKEDVEAIRKEAKEIKSVSPSVNANGQLVFGTNNTPSTLQGVDIPFFSIREINLDRGILFSQNDVDNAAKVCIIGKTIVDELFADGTYPVGQFIRFNNIPLKVIGILEAKGQNAMGQNQDNIVYLPYTTVQKRILAITHYHTIFANAVSEERSANAVTEMTNILKRTHKLQPTDEVDFEIRTQAEMLSMISNVTGMLTALLAAIAAISLIVGGIGIMNIMYMNIMYVTVTERIKEIGLRMAIGALKWDILMQFLTESIIISLIGGIVGILFGILLTFIISSILGWPFIVNIVSILLSFFVCFATGVFFGWYPAKKASQLDPIVALRYE
ncbi:MAG: multidrug transporter substrate-binding protein, partial [Bacteroidetes bacterium]|nr:multidrug transporter substrate-binding protein [Bacteroidota bacterium]